jgi:dTDP-4-dehydrorhamnose reductase
VTRVLVLGQSGMLGSMAVGYLARNSSLELAGTVRNRGQRPVVEGVEQFQFDAGQDVPSQLAPLFRAFPADYVINCIGLINLYCRDLDSAGVLQAVRVNSLFPHVLSEALVGVRPQARVIHISTDCVFSGIVGSYDETAAHDAFDFYGKTKSTGEVRSDRWLNIRCSIIGPEVTRRTSLLEWFLSQPPGARVPGFTHHQWNGVTTLQFAEFCEDIIMNDRFELIRKQNHTVHYAPNESVSKYGLLSIFNEVFGRGCCIEQVCKPTPPINRTLKSIYLDLDSIPMRTAVQQLRDYTAVRYLNA